MSSAVARCLADMLLFSYCRVSSSLGRDALFMLQAAAVTASFLLHFCQQRDVLVKQDTLGVIPSYPTRIGAERV